MTRPSPLAVMRYADGESDADEAREVEAWLKESEDARRELAALSAVGDGVRMVSRSAVESFDVAKSIMERIEREEGAAGGESSGVRPSGVRRTHTVARLVPILGAAAAFAAAAAVALLVGPLAPEQAPEVAQNAATGPSAAEPSPAAREVAPEPVDPPVGAEIQSIEFGGLGGSIFLVQSGADSTPVVWLMDEPVASGDRMEPL